MSNHTNSQLFTNSVYTQQHVGGDPNSTVSGDQQYIDNQLQLIQEADNYLPPNLRYNSYDINKYPISNSNSSSNSSSNPHFKQFSNQNPNSNSNPKSKFRNVYNREDHLRYDPYEGFLFDRGLIEDGTNKRRFKTTYINVDSRFRVKEPSATIDEDIVLDVDPIAFTKSSSSVYINHKNHSFQIGDLIQLTNVSGKNTILRTYNDTGEATLDIKAGFNLLKVFYQHEINLDYKGDTIEVDLSDIKGDRGSVETASYLGNVPINMLNGRHNIVINVDETLLTGDPDDLPQGYLTPSPNYFFIMLPITMRTPSDGTDPYVLGEYNFKLKVLAAGGVPLNYVNARYPIDPDHAQGFHIIRSVDLNGYFIDLAVLALLNEKSGGKSVIINKVLTVESGFPNPNRYNIDLEKTYHNIVASRMISCEFPNSDTTIRDFPAERANNKIYWNDIDDGEHLYSISVPPGNYTPAELATVLEALFLEVPRVNAKSQDFTFEDNHFIRVTINSNTNKVVFDSFKEFCLIQPIIDVDPDIALDPASADPKAEANATYTLTINHPGHGMVTAGESILMLNAVPHLGIPTDTLNTTHTVTEIIDENTYKIVLPNCAFNLSRSRFDTKGGNASKIYIPDTFRLRFDEDDTLGSMLGFRNPGDENSVYAFAKSISNNDPYRFEQSTNALGEVVDISNNFIRLSGDDYVLMVAEPIQTMTNIGPNKFIFAKIQLCDSPGKVLFNTHVNTTKVYDNSNHEVSTLEISFYSPDGYLYDFNGLDHSFTLELVTVDDIPQGTGISSNTGRNYNISV